MRGNGKPIRSHRKELSWVREREEEKERQKRDEKSKKKILRNVLNFYLTSGLNFCGGVQ